MSSIYIITILFLTCKHTGSNGYKDEGLYNIELFILSYQRYLIHVSLSHKATNEFTAESIHTSHWSINYTDTVTWFTLFTHFMQGKTQIMKKRRLNNLMKWGENTGEWNFEIIFWPMSLSLCVVWSVWLVLGVKINIQVDVIIKIYDCRIREIRNAYKYL